MNWKTILVVLIALGVGITVLFNIAFRPPTPPVHEVFVNGQVLTMDEQNSIAEAISLRDGQVEVFASEGSGRISGLSWAEGLVELPDEAVTVMPGTPVAYYPFSAFS